MCSLNNSALHPWRQSQSGGRDRQEKEEKFYTQSHFPHSDISEPSLCGEQEILAKGGSFTGLTSRTPTILRAQSEGKKREMCFPLLKLCTRSPRLLFPLTKLVTGQRTSKGQMTQTPGSQAHCLGWSLKCRPLLAETKAGLSVPASPGKKAQPLTQSP